MLLVAGLFTAAAVILSFLGWGSLVSRLVFGKVTGAWPFRAAWGMAAVALVGGILNSLEAVSVPANLAVLTAGLLLSAPLMRSLPDWRQAIGSSPGPALLITGVAVVVLVVVAASLFPLRWEPNDDAIAYAMFPRKMLDTGALVEPFSNRRIVSFGGYHYLHSLILSLLSHHELHLLDRGIATVLTGSALVCFVRHRLAAPWSIACLAGVFFMLFPPIRVNLAPTCVLSLLSLTLLETFLLSGEARHISPWRRAVILALVTAGLLAMRANALAIVGSLTVALVLSERTPGVHGMASRLRLLGLIGVVGAILLTPWAVALAHSSGTPFFPLIKGYYNNAVPMSVAKSAGEWVSFLWENFTYAHLQYLLGFALVAYAIGAMPGAMMCYVVSALLTALATIAAFNLSGGFCMARYHGPFTTVAFVLTGAALGTHAWHWVSRAKFGTDTALRRVLLGAGVAACLVVAAAALTRGGWRAELKEHGWNPQAVLEARVQASYQAALPLGEKYRQALATLPPRSRILAAIDAPFLLDFKLHEIICIDDIGVVNPPPGLPLQGGGEALRSFLTGLGFTHLLYVKPDISKTIYSRALWSKPDLEPIWRLRAPYCLAFFDAADALAATGPVLYDSPDAVIISLSAASLPTP